VRIAVLAVPVYLLVTLGQVWTATRWDDRSPTDAIVVMGAAQYDGRPSPVLQARLDHALDLYRAGVAPTVVVTGSKRPGDRVTEAYAGLAYLMGRGVPERSIIVVDDGSSTFESLASSGRVLHRRDVDEVTIVSDPYHSFRLVGIADEEGLTARISPTDTRYGTGELLKEWAVVSASRLVGYQRMVRWFG
jgi:uncharacterized SAM-binding protein YcdF (DUF218 family)